MYASALGDFYNLVAAFESEMESLERQIALEGRDPLTYVDALGVSSDSLMVAARNLEDQLAGAQDLLRDTQKAFRRLVSGFFGRCRFLERALNKPRGYAGDHLMLDLLYRGEMAESGIGRTLDAYVMEMPVVRAVRSRKEYVKSWLAARIAQNPNAKVVDLACGPCRIEQELIDEGRAGNATFVALDHDAEAIAYAKAQLGAGVERFTFHRENALLLARGRGNPERLAGADLLVCLGLFDYLPRDTGAELIKVLRQSLAPGAEILIGNFDDHNPSQTFMEWAVDWPLVYRSSHDFFELFLDAGFPRENVVPDREGPDGLVLMFSARVGDKP